MSLIKCLGKIRVPVSHRAYGEGMLKSMLEMDGYYSSQWIQELLDVDPRRYALHGGHGKGNSWDNTGSLVGGITPSLTKQEYFNRYACETALMPLTDSALENTSRIMRRGSEPLPPPMDDRLIKDLEKYHKGSQVHNLMTAQGVGVHKDVLDDVKMTCLIIPILTKGLHALVVEDRIVPLRQGFLYSFNQEREHELRFIGKNEGNQNVCRPCVLLSVNFERAVPRQSRVFW